MARKTREAAAGHRSGGPVTIETQESLDQLMEETADAGTAGGAPEVVNGLVKRLRRVEGQARGLQKMLIEGRECEDLIIQLAAMREAISKVGMVVIGKYMEKCLREDIAQGKSGKEGLERALNILMKFS
ncbi:MAG: metal-sensitive transcriptional regulator [Bacillota bacterium]